MLINPYRFATGTVSTWDSATKGASVVLSNGDLDATKAGVNYQTVYGVQGRLGGRYAFEVLITARPSASAILVGIADKTNTATTIGTYIGNTGTTEALGYNDDNGAGTFARIVRRMTVGNIPLTNTTPLYTVGDIITVDVNMAVNFLEFFKNGVAIAYGTIAITASKTYFPALSLQNGAAGRIITSGLTYLPSGATAWG